MQIKPLSVDNPKDSVQAERFMPEINLADQSLTSDFFDKFEVCTDQSLPCVKGGARRAEGLSNPVTNSRQVSDLWLFFL